MVGSSVAQLGSCSRNPSCVPAGSLLFSGQKGLGYGSLQISSRKLCLLAFYLSSLEKQYRKSALSSGLDLTGSEGGHLCVLCPLGAQRPSAPSSSRHLNEQFASRPCEQNLFSSSKCRASKKAREFLRNKKSLQRLAVLEPAAARGRHSLSWALWVGTLIKTQKRK